MFGDGGFINYNLSYFILVLPVLFISLICQARVKSAYGRFSRVANSRGITGAVAAQMILDFYGITDVRIQQIAGELTDNFNPSTKIISLSSGVYGGTSIAAVGIACHEAGHAAQHAQGYLPIKLRNAVIKPAQIGSAAAVPIAILGYILGLQRLITFGILLYVFIML
ncbi:MAG: zinc metallopeptidase, partial [Ruminococcaceae bacterium]|nr:zinc metallopeptidase [Oscillospiraceae bacterium]